ncbi:hypothetical protein Psal081_03443 (plasmid) [Piscirickettsia salmonis]|nr:hypothetical protein Psal081_03443 [Piscirickettsia salmonis]
MIINLSILDLMMVLVSSIVWTILIRVISCIKRVTSIIFISMIKCGFIFKICIIQGENPPNNQYRKYYSDKQCPTFTVNKRKTQDNYEDTCKQRNSKFSSFCNFNFFFSQCFWLIHNTKLLFVVISANFHRAV